MMLNAQKRAFALLLLVCGQYVFAASAAATQVPGKVKAYCKDKNYSLQKVDGKDVCVAKPSACPAGSTMKGNKCCHAGMAYGCRGNGAKCASGEVSTKVCDHPLTGAAAQKGRRLQTTTSADKGDININLSKDGSVATGKSKGDININGKMYMPIIKLPEPAVSIDIQKSSKMDKPLISKNIDTKSLFPTFVLPEPKVILDFPTKDVKGGQINVVGSMKPKDIIVPILPTPSKFLTIPEKPIDLGMPGMVNFNIEKVPLMVDLSGAGPGKQINLQVPDMKPALDALKPSMPDVEVNVVGGSKVIDLTGIYGKNQKTTIVKLPEIKKAVAPNVTVVLPNKDGKTNVKYVDLSGLVKGSTDGKVTNIVLPSVSVTGQKDINIDLGGKDLKPKTITVPGKGKTEVVNVKIPELIKVPDVQKKVTVTVNTGGKDGPKLMDVLNKMNGTRTTTVVDLSGKPIDLSFGLDKPKDIVITVPDVAGKAMSWPNSVDVTSIKPKVADIKTVNTVKLGKDVNINLGGKDVNISLPLLDKPMWDSLDANQLAALLGSAQKDAQGLVNSLDLSKWQTIQVPALSKPVDALLTVPLGMFGKDVSIQYTETVDGKTAAQSVAAGSNAFTIMAVPQTGMVDDKTAAKCPSKCCMDKLMDVCSKPPTGPTKPVSYTCEKGCTMTSGKCMCPAKLS